jgi:hypothetical protein
MSSSRIGHIWWSMGVAMGKRGACIAGAFGGGDGAGGFQCAAFRGQGARPQGAYRKALRETFHLGPGAPGGIQNHMSAPNPPITANLPSLEAMHQIPESCIKWGSK